MTLHPDLPFPKEKYSLLENCQRFSSHGHTYFIDSKEAEGFYWFYETDYFCLAIHDLHIKKTLYLVRLLLIVLIRSLYLPTSSPSRANV